MIITTDGERIRMMTSKQRSYLKSLAMKEPAILQIGSGSVTPEFTSALREALEKRELVKVHVLKNCTDDKASVAEMLAGRTRSEVVQIIGNKIVFFRYQTDASKRKIDLRAIV